MYPMYGGSGACPLGPPVPPPFVASGVRVAVPSSAPVRGDDGGGVTTRGGVPVMASVAAAVVMKGEAMAVGAVPTTPR